MDTDQLKTFVTVAELQSVSQAAIQLFLTQPAVTRRLQILEAHVGQPLFDRVGRRLLLTEAGNCLLPYARQILRLMLDGQQALHDLANVAQGTLTLVTSHHIGLHRLPAILREYKQRYPAVALRLRFMNSQEAHEAIRHGEADLGVTTEEETQDPGVLREEIWRDRLEVVVAPEHPLARVSKLCLQDLAAYPAILPDARFYTGRIVREQFQRQGITLRIDPDLSTDYLETLKALVVIGVSWSVLPVTMLGDNTLRILQVEGVAMARSLVAIRHAKRNPSKAVQAFIELLRQQGDASS